VRSRFKHSPDGFVADIVSTPNILPEKHHHQPSTIYFYGHQIIYGDQIISFQHPFMDIYGMVVGQTMPSTIYSW
jgi:hypothetical protein